MRLRWPVGLGAARVALGLSPAHGVAVAEGVTAPRVGDERDLRDPLRRLGEAPGGEPRQRLDLADELVVVVPAAAAVGDDRIYESVVLDIGIGEAFVDRARPGVDDEQLSGLGVLLLGGGFRRAAAATDDDETQGR